MTTLIVTAGIITNDMHQAPKIVDVLNRAMLGLALEGLVCKIEMTSCDDEEEFEVIDETQGQNPDQTPG